MDLLSAHITPWGPQMGDFHVFGLLPNFWPYWIAIGPFGLLLVPWVAIGIAFQGLQSQYNEANGYEGRMLQGKPASSAGDVFRSQAELVAAMGDPRYDTDPAYRADVVAKLDQSDLEF